MRFRLDDDQLAMRDAVRQLCAHRLPLDAVAAREEQPADATLWRALADLGVLGLLAGEPGSGTGVVEATVVFEVLGAHLVTGPVLWSTLTAPLIDGVADGEGRVAGVSVPSGPHGPVPVEHLDEADVLVVLHEDRVERIARADLPASQPGSSLDPLTPVAVLPLVPSGEMIGDADEAARLRRTGAVLAAAMLVGGAQQVLDVARDYALEREQFGVPIGSFQAVKHLLADAYVRTELARAATYAAAAIAADPRAGDAVHAASTAKLLAGEAGIANARTAVQVLGGMGFTWDMLPHYFLKRAWVLEHLFGTTSAHAGRLATAVQRDVVASHGTGH
jgi:alkylation response protein AidB-like acyl-CoA dehydrogenase